MIHHKLLMLATIEKGWVKFTYTYMTYSENSKGIHSESVQILGFVLFIKSNFFFYLLLIRLIPIIYI